MEVWKENFIYQINCKNMIIMPTPEQVIKAKQDNVWDFGNKLLYDLCQNNFDHDQDECI